MYLCLIFNVLLKDANALVNVLLPNDNHRGLLDTLSVGGTACACLKILVSSVKGILLKEPTKNKRKLFFLTCLSVLLFHVAAEIYTLNAGP